MTEERIWDLLLGVLLVSYGYALHYIVDGLRNWRRSKGERKIWREACRNWKKISKVCWFSQLVFEIKTCCTRKRKMVALKRFGLGSLQAQVDSSKIPTEIKNRGYIGEGERFILSAKDAKKFKGGFWVRNDKAESRKEIVIPFRVPYFVDDIGNSAEKARELLKIS